MSENEILARGIVAGMSIVIPFLGITIARWHSWKCWCKFWKMMHKDLQAQNERLFRALKREEDKSRYFESKLKHIAKLEERIADGDRDFEMANHQNERLLKIVNHHKYKRCLAMARTCKRNRLHFSVCGPVEKIDFWDKWRKRWLELAEKFK